MSSSTDKLGAGPMLGAYAGTAFFAFAAYASTAGPGTVRGVGGRAQLAAGVASQFPGLMPLFFGFFCAAFGLGALVLTAMFIGEQLPSQQK